MNKSCKYCECLIKNKPQIFLYNSGFFFIFVYGNFPKIISSQMFVQSDTGTKNSLLLGYANTCITYKISQQL